VADEPVRCEPVSSGRNSLFSGKKQGMREMSSAKPSKKPGFDWRFKEFPNAGNREHNRGNRERFRVNRDQLKDISDPQTKLFII